MSFTRQEYRRVFELGRLLLNESRGNADVHAAGVELMAMAESVIGPQMGWPCSTKRYRYKEIYPEPRWPWARLLLAKAAQI